MYTHMLKHTKHTHTHTHIYTTYVHIYNIHTHIHTGGFIKGYMLSLRKISMDAFKVCLIHTWIVSYIHAYILASIVINDRLELLKLKHVTRVLCTSIRTKTWKYAARNGHVLLGWLMHIHVYMYVCMHTCIYTVSIAICIRTCIWIDRAILQERHPCCAQGSKHDAALPHHVCSACW
jgi:hypothetical protein